MTLTIAILGALAAGYALGRTKPCARASSWAHWLFYGTNRPTRRHVRWWFAQIVFAGEIAVLLATRPRQTIHAWQHRNDPPPPRSPAPAVRRINRAEEQP